MLEDHLGFIWITSQVGLFRYDGYELKAYRHDINDTTSLSSPSVQYVAEDQQGQLWVSTIYGISLLDRRTGMFKQFLPYPKKLSTKGGNSIQDLFIDSKNRLWAIGRDNVFAFDKNNHAFRMIKGDSDPDSIYDINSIFEAPDGTIWFGATEGLLKLLPGDTSFTLAETGTDGNAARINDINHIVEGKNGMLWIATNRGLILFDPKSGVLKSNILPESCSKFRITRLLKSKDNYLWMALGDQGLGLLNTSGSFQHFLHIDGDASSIQDNSVQSILEDKFGNIWIGTSAGISRIPAGHAGFELLKNKTSEGHFANQVNRILRDQQGALWTQTDKGLMYKSSASAEGYPFPIHSLSPDQSFGEWIYEDPAGNVWLPIENHGLWKKEKLSSSFFEVPVDDILQESHIDKIIGDNQRADIMWMGANGGLVEFDRQNFSCKWHRPKDQLEGISSNRVVIFEQFQNDIWLYYTYNNSLGRFDKTTGHFELIRPPEAQGHVLEGVIRDIAISSDGNIWLPTSYGLTRYHIPSSKFFIYTSHNGLPENGLNAVLIDDQNRIWVSGDQFVSKFDLKTESFQNYRNIKKGKSFISKSRYLDANGRIYFGTLNGIFTFHPDSIYTDQTPPNVVLTNFRVKNEIYLLDEAVEYVKSIKLAHDQNDVAFDFSAIHLLDPEANQYRCRLEGYDKEWQELGFKHTINYTNLNPDAYVFRVQASNRDGIWNREGLNISLVIMPPFTQTVWFRTMLFIVIALLVYLIFRIWSYQQLLRRQKEVAEEAAEYRMQFLSHISHEIRTPMNAIINLSGLAVSTDLNKQQRQYLNAIEHSSKDLLEIINQLLDHSKLEAGMFSFANNPFTLRTILTQLDAMLQPLAQVKQLSFQIMVGEGVPQNLIGDSLRLTQILTNLVGNAIKFSEKGHIELSMHVEQVNGDSVLLMFEVSDTGIGISEERLEHVFDRFVEEGNTLESGGTGLGLFITRELVIRQGGSISIASEINKGTQVFVKMPFLVNNDRPGADITDQSDSVDQIHSTPRILIVDDAPFNLLVMTEMIKKQIPQAIMVTAESGKLALAEIQIADFDLIIMDVRMPDMDGYETTQHIRQMSGQKGRTPVLGATAGAMPAQIQKCIDSGMSAVITKPVEMNVLIDKIISLTQIQKP